MPFGLVPSHARTPLLEITAPGFPRAASQRCTHRARPPPLVGLRPQPPEPSPRPASLRINPAGALCLLHRDLPRFLMTAMEIRLKQT